ncbi:MAG: hypothetical protein WC989_02905 [Micavibrio sp.]
MTGLNGQKQGRGRSFNYKEHLWKLPVGASMAFVIALTVGGPVVKKYQQRQAAATAALPCPPLSTVFTASADAEMQEPSSNATRLAALMPDKGEVPKPAIVEAAGQRKQTGENCPSVPL